MKKYIILSILIFINFTTIFANSEIEEYVKSIPNTYSLDYTSKLITKKSNTTLEKVNAIVYWIEENINYDKELAKCGDNCDRKLTDKPSIVFKNKSGVCSSISNLFRYMAIENGLEAYVIGGIGITETKEGEHAWNMVKDGERFIFLDATWGNSYTTYDLNKFSKKHKYNVIYFDYTQGGYEPDDRGFYLNRVFKEEKLLNSNITAKEYRKKEGYTMWYTSTEVRHDNIISVRHVHNYIKNYNKSNSETKTEHKTEHNNDSEISIKKAPSILSMSKKQFRKKSKEELLDYKKEVANFIKSYYYNKDNTTLGDRYYKQIDNAEGRSYKKILKKYRKSYKYFERRK